MIYPAFTKRNRAFFQVYKDLENKTVDVGGWEMLMKHEIIKNVQIF
jgi:inorganic pyrophosphatase